MVAPGDVARGETEEKTHTCKFFSVAPLAARILAAGLTAPADDGCCGGELLAVATCTGSASCRACKNCSACRHCNSGGSCGVCSAGSSGTRTPPLSAAERKRAVAEQDRLKAVLAKAALDQLARRKREAAEKVVLDEAERARIDAAEKVRATNFGTFAAARAAADRGARITTALKLARALDRQGNRAGAVGYYRDVLELTTRGYDATLAANRIRALDPRAKVPVVLAGPFGPPPTEADLRELADELGLTPQPAVAGPRRPVVRRKRR
jgi:hypothetical protein